MIRIILLALILVTTSAQAHAFKFIGPNGYMEASKVLAGLEPATPHQAATGE